MRESRAFSKAKFLDTNKSFLAAAPPRRQHMAVPGMSAAETLVYISSIYGMYRSQSATIAESRWEISSANLLLYSIGQRERMLIKSAIKTFQFLTCLNFVIWTGKADDQPPDYLHIQHSKERPG
jgi:hypothetical protein